MYPRSFEYARAESLEHALELLGEHGDEARPLAGGMSLIPLMKLRLASPTYLIDIGYLSALRGIERRDGQVAIGATTRHVDVEEADWLREHFPLLGDCVRHIGDVQVRNAGTVGGSLAEADPAGDWGPAALALRAQIACRGAGGERTLSADELIQGPYTTALGPDELITEVRLPLPEARSGGAHLKVERRAGDFGVAIASLQLSLDDSGRCVDASIGIGAVGLQPIRAPKAEALLRGERPEGEALEAAAEAVRETLQAEEVLSDFKAPAEYRLDVVQTLFKRAVAVAVERCGTPPRRGEETPNEFGARRRGDASPDESGGIRGLASASRQVVSLRVNGRDVSREVEARRLLVDFIREDLGLTGTHIGCDTSNCGACTVLVDGRSRKSCTMFAPQADGRLVQTIEGVAHPSTGSEPALSLSKGRAELHPIQQAFYENHGLQCGYCTPGMVMSALNLLARNPSPSEHEIRAAISGNICRCTGYHNIVKSIASAAEKLAAQGETNP